METKREWILIKDRKPEIDTEVDLLWTDYPMRGHTERGYLSEGRYGVAWSYAFCGALEPTHWTPVIPLPSLPDDTELHKPGVGCCVCKTPRGCQQCRHGLDVVYDPDKP